MLEEPKTQFSLTRAALCTQGAQGAHSLLIQLLRVTHVRYVVVGLLALSSTAWAQFNPVEPALPGSVEYSLTASNYTWVQTSDPITAGVYVEDLVSDYRLNQPVGRGRVGIVTDTAWDADYNCMAATVDFGRDYSVGVVFPELSAIQLVPIPEPSAVVIVPGGVLLARAVLGRPGRAKAGKGPGVG